MKVNKQSLLSLLLVLMGLVLVGGAFYWFQSTVNSVPTQPSDLEAGIPYPEIPRISLADAKAAYELKNATFIDVRDSMSYSEGHIPGALSIPLEDLSDRINELDPANWYILYCT
jgi:3-mercaptopyruvate sulfurtransferase SseA